MMLCKAHFPNDLLVVTLEPIIEPKTLDQSVSANYRPVGLATAASYLLELIVQERLPRWFYTSDAQFEHKSKLGTGIAIYSLREAVKCYTSRNYPVFVCFQDAYKAFDWVNYKKKKIFAVLRERGAPKFNMRFLCYWYRSQNYYVKLGHFLSSSFNVSNGVS